MTWFKWAGVVTLALLYSGVALAQSSRVMDTPHNLSASGPGSVRASTEEQICIFCHTPHNASGARPLWNRSNSAAAYRVYASNSLQAKPGQPTGTSKKCLSCHDGTVALGNIVSRNQPIMMAGGMTTLPPGKSNLGTDLSDDHPISFKYDAQLVTQNPKLRSPAQLPHQIRLDGNQELQCTTCHEPHNNIHGKFKVMNNEQSQLCKSCHDQGNTAIASHDNCDSCHKPHTAPSGPWLLTNPTISTTCLSCHNGVPGPNAGANILASLQKLSKHDTDSPVTTVDRIPNHVGCSDCHEGHTMSTGSANAPDIQPSLGFVAGVNASGSPVLRAQYEYEVCFKCHGDNAATEVPMISRKAMQTNKRLQFAQSAASYHPVTAPGKNSNVPSLIAPLNTNSMIHCSDCHGSNSSAKAGGTGPNGPHGSDFSPLLIAQYQTADMTSESASAYALCYRCHDRNSILSDQSFPAHRSHIVDQRTPCSACHDSHGIASSQGSVANNAHLINFDLSIVQPHPGRGGPTYTTTGAGTGSCTLRCHSSNHNERDY